MKRYAAVLAVAALVHAPAATGWTWPADGPVLRPFAFGSDPYKGGQHRGIDVGAPPGTSVRSAAPGTVSFAGTVPTGGRTVTMQTPGGLSLTYLELGATRVARGDEVGEGDPIGTIGTAGHVHFGVRVTAEAHGYLDPLQFLPARAAAPARADAPDSPAPAAAQPEPPAAADPVQASVAAEPASRPSPEPEPAQPVQPTQAAVNAVPAAVPAVAEPSTTPVSEQASSGSVAARGGRHQGEPLRLGVDRADVPAPTVDRPRTRRSRSPHGSAAADTAVTGRLSPGATGPRTRPPDVEVRPRIASANDGPVAVSTGAVERQPGPAVVARSPDLEASRQRRLPEALAVGCLVLVLLGAGVAVRRRRRPDATPGSVATTGQVRCPIGRTRPPRLIHACARSTEPHWLLPQAPRRAVVVPMRALPRAKRRAPVGALA